MYIENRIRIYRAIHNLTQAELALKVGLSQTTIVQFEQGRSLPRIDKAIELANLFNISVAELFFEKGKNIPTRIPEGL